MSDSLRDTLAATLKPLLPSGWRFIPNQRTPETISVVTVVLKHLEINPLEEAPRSGHLGNGVVVTVLDPHQDDVKAEIALDDSVLALIHAIESAGSWLRFDSAKKIQSGKYLGWDVNLTAITNSRE